MRTLIKLEFDKISKERLDKIQKQLESLKLRANIETSVEETSDEFTSYVSDQLSDWSREDLIDWIVQYGPMAGFTQTYQSREDED